MAVKGIQQAVTLIFPFLLLLAGVVCLPAYLVSRRKGVESKWFPVLSLPALLICSSLAGCSKEAVNQSVYESMRHISNEENAENPNYDPDGIEDYNQYKAIREGQLEEEQ
jgi:hypothetical protein